MLEIRIDLVLLVLNFLIIAVLLYQSRLGSKPKNKRHKPKPNFLKILNKEIPLDAFLQEDLNKHDLESSHHALLAVQAGLKKAIEQYNQQKEKNHAH